MEFTYSTNIDVLHAQVESTQIGVKASKRDDAVATLIGFVAYLRSGSKLGFETDQDFAKALGVNKSVVSKALTVVKLGAPQLVAKNGHNVFATPDESVVATVEALVDAHNGKAISGIYAALTADEPQVDKWTLAAAVATLFASALKRELSVADVVSEVLAQAEQQPQG